jgi:hypothetical protein
MIAVWPADQLRYWTASQWADIQVLLRAGVLMVMLLKSIVIGGQQNLDIAN